MIFFHNRKVNRQNDPKSIILNASIKVEASVLQFGYNYSILLIKSGIFHSIGTDRTVVLTGAKGSNRITLILHFSGVPVLPLDKSIHYCMIVKCKDKVK